jgi:DNA anti-recombination protein RmuC
MLLKVFMIMSTTKLHGTLGQVRLNVILEGMSTHCNYRLYAHTDGELYRDRCSM